MRRNPIIPRLILVFPCMMMILMPWAANLEIKYNNLAVVDLDHSALSRRLVEKVASTDYFNLVENAPDYGRALESVERGEADVILEIPRDFAKSLGTGRPWNFRFRPIPSMGPRADWAVLTFLRW